MARHLLMLALVPSLTCCGVILGLDTFQDEAQAGAGGDAAGGAGGDAGAGGQGGAVSSAYAESVLEDSPVGYWRLDERVGPAINVVDPSTNAIVGPDVETGVDGAVGGDGAFSFTDSALASVEVADLAAFDFANTTPFSLEVWFRLESPPVGDALLTRFDQGVGYALRLAVDGSLEFARSPAPDVDGGPDPDVVAFRLPDGFVGSYHHVVAVYANETLELYYDGQATEPTTGVTRDMATISSVPLVFGAEPLGSGLYLDGDLDEIAVYDHALGIDRVLAHYCAAMPSAEGCNSQ